jgi:hypothetical protein
LRVTPDVYEGSGPAVGDEDDDPDPDPERESALSRAERDSIASRQGKLRAGFEGAAAPEEREEDEEKRRDWRDCDEEEVVSNIDVDVGVGDRNGLCSRRLANRRD